MYTPAYQRFRDLLRARDYVAAAEHAIHASTQEGERTAFWLTQQAVALNLADRPTQALSAAESVLALEPSNPYALAARAEAHVRLRRFDVARAEFEELLQSGPVAVRARDGLLHCLAATRDWTRMLAVLGASDPSQRDCSWRAKALHGLGRSAEAIQVCQQWLAIEKDLPAALWLLVEIETAQEGVEVVRDRYARLARIPGRAPIYREIFASLCRRSGQDQQAATEYAAIAAVRPESRIQRREAFALAKSGRESAAIPLMEELLRADPRDTYVHSSYGAACKRVGALERAWKFYGDLLALHPSEKGLYGRRRRIAQALEAAPPADNSTAPAPGACKPPPRPLP